MTKERLEELIKQCATIWYGRCRWGCPIKLDTVHFVIVNDRLYYQKNKKRIGDGWELKELREDVDRAKWHLKNDAVRTERFEPPMWEDIEDYYRFNFVLDNKLAAFVVGKGSWITVAVNGGAKKLFEVHRDDVIKENYEKACEIVRDLFGGGRNE